MPTLDISRFEQGSEEFVGDLGRAYQEWGFAGITGHGIDPATIDQSLRAAQSFFSLPILEKQAFSHPSAWSRGYVPQGVEKAKDAEYPDLKEFFHLGRESQLNTESNIWPNDHSFKKAFIELHQALDVLSLKILRAMALFLGLPESYFESSVCHGEALLRILHYPPIVDQEIPNERAAAHEDINLITLLVGSEQDGLEIQNIQGDWVPINMIEGTIICNVGDMMHRLSNGLLRSTTHRVINPKGENAQQSRYSMPFFVHPDPSMSLACLPQCCSEIRPKQYDDITAGEFHRQRLEAIGF